MRVTTQEQYDKYENGTIFDIYLSGTDWQEDYGKRKRVIKIDDQLFEIGNLYLFSERNENPCYGLDYTFEVSIKGWQENK